MATGHIIRRSLNHFTSFTLSYRHSPHWTLVSNQIGDQGAQHLANALQQNKVTFSFSLYITHSLLHTDTHHTGPQ